MQLTVRNTDNLIVSYGNSNNALDSAPGCTIYNLSYYQEQDWNNTKPIPYGGGYFDGSDFSFTPWVAPDPTPPTISAATTSAYKEQVINALVSNIGQTVTKDTVEALLNYLGNLP